MLIEVSLIEALTAFARDQRVIILNSDDLVAISLEEELKALKDPKVHFLVNAPAPAVLPSRILIRLRKPEPREQRKRRQKPRKPNLSASTRRDRAVSRPEHDRDPSPLLIPANARH